MVTCGVLFWALDGQRILNHFFFCFTWRIAFLASFLLSGLSDWKLILPIVLVVILRRTPMADVTVSRKFIKSVNFVPHIPYRKSVWIGIFPIGSTNCRSFGSSSVGVYLLLFSCALVVCGCFVPISEQDRRNL